MKFLRFLLLFAFTASWGGCTCSGPQSTNTAANPNSAPAGKPVQLAIWSNYISDDVLQKFTAETGYPVVVSNYSSNEELLSKMQAGATGYDVIVPSDYMVRIMSQLNLVEPLDKSKLPSAAGVDPQFMAKNFDPENRFSLPYSWSTAGLAVNTKLVTQPVKGWGDLVKNSALSGKFSLLDDNRETIGAILKMNGASLNSRIPAELEQAKSLLMGMRSHVKAFTSEPMDQLLAGEFAVSHIYSSDALQAAAQSGGAIQFVMPEEGGSWSIDNLAIPKGGQNPEGAHAFINYVLKPEHYAAIVTARMFGPVVRDIKPLLPAELQANPVLFPPKSASLARFEMMEDLGESSEIWDRIWTEIKAASH